MWVVLQAWPSRDSVPRRRRGPPPKAGPGHAAGSTWTPQAQSLFRGPDPACACWPAPLACAQAPCATARPARRMVDPLSPMPLSARHPLHRSLHRAVIRLRHGREAQVCSTVAQSSSAQPALPQRGAASRKACSIAGCGAACAPVARYRPRVAPACACGPLANSLPQFSEAMGALLTLRTSQPAPPPACRSQTRPSTPAAVDPKPRHAPARRR